MKISYKIYRIQSKMLGFDLDDKILEEIREEHFPYHDLEFQFEDEAVKYIEEHSERFEKMRLTILKTYTQW